MGGVASVTAIFVKGLLYCELHYGACAVGIIGATGRGESDYEYHSPRFSNWVEERGLRGGEETRQTFLTQFSLLLNGEKQSSLILPCP